MSPGRRPVAARPLASDLFVWSFERRNADPSHAGDLGKPRNSPRFSPDGPPSRLRPRRGISTSSTLTGDELRLTHRRRREHAQRQARLGLPGGDLRPRQTTQAHWWSPDSRRLAFLQSDERDVPRFTVVDHVPLPAAARGSIPLPQGRGPEPPASRLGIAKASGGGITWIDPGLYGHTEILIVNVTFSPDGDVLVPGTGSQTDVPRPSTGPTRRPASPSEFCGRSPTPGVKRARPAALPPGRRLPLVQRTDRIPALSTATTGTAKLAKTLTDGRWEVRSLNAVDEEAGFAYVSGTYRSALGADVLRMSLDGSAPALLTETPGSHRASFPGGRAEIEHWIATSSDLHTRRTTMTLRSASGETVRDRRRAANVPDLERFDISQPELPEHHDQRWRRPGGNADSGRTVSRSRPRLPGLGSRLRAVPHAQQVRDGWQGSRGHVVPVPGATGGSSFSSSSTIASPRARASSRPGRVYRNFSASRN